MKYTKHGIKPESGYENTHLQILSFCCSNNKVDSEFIVKSVKAINQLPIYKGLHKRLIPVVLEKVQTLKLENDFSPETYRYLKNETQKGIVAEFGKQKQLRELIQLFEQNDIPMILLKASAFNGVLYSNEYPRTSNDIDILVKEKHWEKAKLILLNIMDYMKPQKTNVFDDLYESSFIPKGEVGANVDLHKSLVHPFLFDISEDELWNNSLVHPVYNKDKVRVLSPEDTLNHLAIHGFKDIDFSGYNIVDINRVLTLNIDLENVMDTSLKIGSQRPLYVLLKNYSNILNCSLLNEILSRIKPKSFVYFFANVLQAKSFNRPHLSCSSYSYRLHQLTSQYIFTSSFRKSLKLQWLYLKCYVIKKTSEAQ